MKKFIKALSVALVLALCLPMALAFTTTTTAAKVEPDRDTDEHGATFIYFDNYDAAASTVSFAGKTMAVDTKGYGTLSAATEQGYGLKFTSVGANEMNLWFNSQVCSGNLLSAGTRYITMRIKVVNSGLDEMGVYFANNNAGIPQARHTFAVTGDWQVVTYDSTDWGALWSGTSNQRVCFSAIPAGAYILIDYIGLVWNGNNGLTYEASAKREADAQAAFYEALAMQPTKPSNRGELDPVTAPVADRDEAGFIYFDNATAEGFTSNGKTSPFSGGTHVGKVEAANGGYGIKLTNAGFTGQTIVDFYNKTGVINGGGEKIAVRVKVVNAPAETMSINIGQGNNNKSSTTFTPTGEWQTVVMDTVWGSLWTDALTRVNFGADGEHAGMTVYLDWIASSHNVANFDDVIVAEAEKQEAFYAELAKDTTSDVVVDRDTTSFIYFDNWDGDSFVSNGVECAYNADSRWANVEAANANGYGIKLTRHAGALGGQTIFDFMNYAGVPVDTGNQVAIRVKVVNAGVETMALTVRNHSQNVQSAVEFVPTGDWQTVVLDAAKFTLWSNHRIRLIFGGDLASNVEIYIDWLASSYKHADFDADIAAEVATQEKLWDAMGTGDETGFLGVQQNAANDIRFVAARKNWRCVSKAGFDVVIKQDGAVIGSNANSVKKESKLAYASILADGEEVLAGDLNWNYNGCFMFTYSLKGVPSTGTYTLEVTPYAIYRNFKQLGATYTVTVVDGVVTSVVG